MHDLYDTLRVTPNATLSQIKKAYRKLALEAHPDKGGDGIRMRFLNEAYTTLSNPQSRQRFDEHWAAYKMADDEAETTPSPVSGYLTGNARPYSDAYKRLHANMVVKYDKDPLKSYSHKAQLSSFIPSSIKVQDINPLLSLPINLENATKLLIACLSGEFANEEIFIKITRYFSIQIGQISTHEPNESVLEYYTGIKEIIFMLPKAPQEQKELIYSLKKITDFAKGANEAQILQIISLFYNKPYRQLLIHALNLYWQSEDDVLHNKPLDGYSEAKEFLHVLRERLAREQNEHLTALVRFLRLLKYFEKDLHEAGKKASTAEDYRKLAFHSLDWISIFIEGSTKFLLLNLFLQIGVLFQQASRLEPSPAIRMADEQLASQLYMTAITIGHHATPDAEIYANTQIIKRLSVFQFATDTHDELIEALTKRTYSIVDMFPFVEAPQTNIAIFRQGSHSLKLMRQLLNAMLHAYEYNKTHKDAIPIQHSAAAILYQAYEGCLKNWYQEEYDPEVEKKFRLNLMEELLLDKGLSCLDVEELLDYPWIMVDRDEQGWLRPTRALPLDEKDIEYRSINGVEINHGTGTIQFFLTRWTRDRPIYEKTFALFDLEDMLGRNMSAAIFSLESREFCV